MTEVVMMVELNDRREIADTEATVHDLDGQLTVSGRLISADVRSPLRAIAGFDTYAGVLTFAEALHRRGYSDDDVLNILGENYLRLFATVWRDPNR